MYNLTVDQAHTFFVGEGQWLVHNSNCLARMDESLLQQAVINGRRNVSGFRVWGNAGLAGETYNINILLLEAESKGAVPIGRLVGAFESEALAAGASRISVGGYDIVNSKLAALLENPALAARYGYAVEKIGDNVFMTKILR